MSYTLAVPSSPAVRRKELIVSAKNSELEASKVVQPDETHQEPKRKEKGCSGPVTKPRRGIHCLGLTLKTHQTTKQDQGDAWQKPPQNP